MVSIPIHTVNSLGEEEDAHLITLFYSSHKLGSHIFLTTVCVEEVCMWECVLFYTDDLIFKVCCLKSSRDPIFLLIMARQNFSHSCTWLQEHKLNLHSLLEALIPIWPVLQGCVDESWLISFAWVKLLPYVRDSVVFCRFLSVTDTFASCLLVSLYCLSVINTPTDVCETWYESEFVHLVIRREKFALFSLEWLEAWINLW